MRRVVCSCSLVFVLAACSFPMPPLLDEDGGVDAAPSHFAVAAAPPGFIRIGTSGEVSVTVSRDAGFTDDVTVVLSGLPAGVSAPPITFSASETTRAVPVEVDAAATPGDYRPTATGTAGALVRTAGFDLVVAGQRGTLDVSFGEGGIGLPPDSLPGEIFAPRIYPTADGFILCGSLVAGDLFVVRLDRAGIVDRGFGVDGVARVAAPFRMYPRCALGGDGAVVFVGYRDVDPDPDAEDYDLVMARLLADGSLDTSIGAAGFATITDPSRSLAVQAVAVDAQGRVLVTGSVRRPAEGGGAPFSLHVSRLTAGGAADAGFGASGTYLGLTTRNERGSTIWIRPDGVILVGTEALMWPDHSFRAPLVYALRDSGSLETSFGGGGGAVALPNPRDSGGQAATILPATDGTALVLGSVHGGYLTFSDAAVWRILPSGLDPSFGEEGVVVHQRDDRNTQYSAAVMVDAARVVALGTDAAAQLAAPARAMSTWLGPEDAAVQDSVADAGRMFVAPGGESAFHQVTSAAATPDGRVTALVTISELFMSDRLRIVRFWY
jgi:uncharacterized delta-60 repeat protein